VISRIGKMPINDVSRLGVSNWIRSMLFYEHRKMGALIPRPDELAEKGGASSQAIIKGKKYKGGLVIEPKPGVFFDVSVLDFASLYPSLIKVHNLSYETVNCPHAECQDNTVPDTTSWVCKKRKGITSLVTGSLRDLRVSHYKPMTRDTTLSKEDREVYNVVTQGLKVFLNASYGVMGFETFAFYCLPVAEATASLGRDAITKTIQKCAELGISVLYSDTDSLFLQNPSKEQVASVTRWAEKELGVELDLDKTYRYVAFSSRKKNYFGVLPDGTPDIKGLTGKKSQTPDFLKQTFYEALGILSRVKTESDFEKARADSKALLTRMITQLKNSQVPVEQLAFNVMMGKPMEKYGDTTPQHVRAAKLLEERGKEIKAGEIIAYVNTKSPPYVKPVELARVDEIDSDKYIEYAHSMFDQMLDALDFSFDEMLGATTLDFFWST
jgi:DNA polymerase I